MALFIYLKAVAMGIYIGNRLLQFEKEVSIKSRFDFPNILRGDTLYGSGGDYNHFSVEYIRPTT